MNENIRTESRCGYAISFVETGGKWWATVTPKTHTCTAARKKTPPYIKEEKENEMKVNDYQRLASRTINNNLSREQKEYHALHGLTSEIGELHDIYQKKYQGHAVDFTHAKKELGDILWFIAEYCTSMGWYMDDIMKMNIEKLKSRYPEGFESEKSLNRKEGDI